MSENGNGDALFDANEYAVAWREWEGMPEYVHNSLVPVKTILVHFKTEDDARAFSELIGQPITLDVGGRYTTSVWYPKAPIGRFSDKRYADES